MKRGCFISIEGGEGVGKSTQIAAIEKAMTARGLQVVITREPGGTDGAETIRRMILDGSKDRWTARTEALLFAAARSDHVARLISPALEEGKWVISDRFIDSSRAYQGQGTDGDSNADTLTDSDIMDMHRMGSGGMMPDRTLVLTLNDIEANRRAAARDGGAGDRIQSRSGAFHARVHDAFVRFASEEPDRVRLVDASGSPDAVTQRMLAELADLLP